MQYMSVLLESVLEHRCAHLQESLENDSIQLTTEVGIKCREGTWVHS